MSGTTLTDDDTILLYRKRWLSVYCDFTRYIVQFVSANKHAFWSDRYKQWTIYPLVWERILKCVDAYPGSYVIEFVVTSENCWFRLPVETAANIGQEIQRTSGMRYVIPGAAAETVDLRGQVIKEGKTYGYGRSIVATRRQDDAEKSDHLHEKGRAFDKRRFR